jgi:hypothetical protein
MSAYRRIATAALYRGNVSEEKQAGHALFWKVGQDTMNLMSYAERITSDPAKRGGKPSIRGH